MRLGTALFEYIKHLAVVHASTQLLVLYSTSSPGTTAFWRRRVAGVDHWAAACGDDNEASRQVPEPLYVSIFNGRDHFLCRRDLEELEGDSLQALTQSMDTVKVRLRDKFKLPDVAEAEGPPDELQKGACHRAQPCIIGLPGVSPSPLDAGVLLGWYHAADDSYFFAEHLKTDDVLENDSSTVARCAAIAANALCVLRPFPPISSSTLQALLAVSR